MGASSGCENVDDSPTRRSRAAPRLAPDPAALDHVGVDQHLDALRQIEVAERGGRDASRRLDEADRSTKISHRLVEQLRAEADRLLSKLTETEGRLTRSREECAELQRGREVAELERDQLRADIAQARQTLREAAQADERSRTQIGSLTREQVDLTMRLERMTDEEKRAREACARLESAKIEQWLLHDGTMALPEEKARAYTREGTLGGSAWQEKVRARSQAPHPQMGSCGHHLFLHSAAM
eukprot:CAMPEP_0183386604 /NCGR_PEP_ID=MMETSP0370-20130417/2498_1 /TAXON_ID=268820 /ORGANISM="Peridinium aciculiferum, Strain PAER-2" /LENGTH=240 /DNA_ID=CAMNT_0025564965 /DNA_START=104 /DNA_END=824 /DNA_ORIENTATION=+